MVGRAAYMEPALLLRVDPDLYGVPAPRADPFAAVEAFEPYVAGVLQSGERLHAVTRHMLACSTGGPRPAPSAATSRRTGCARGGSRHPLRAAIALVSRDRGDAREAA